LLGSLLGSLLPKAIATTLGLGTLGNNNLESIFISLNFLDGSIIIVGRRLFLCSLSSLCLTLCHNLCSSSLCFSNLGLTISPSVVLRGRRNLNNWTRLGLVCLDKSLCQSRSALRLLTLLTLVSLVSLVSLSFLSLLFFKFGKLVCKTKLLRSGSSILERFDKLV